MNFKPITNSQIAHARLHNQRVAATTFDSPAEVVSWMGAVQAQDYTGGLWAVGLRTKSATEADVRWMLELLTPASSREARAGHKTSNWKKRTCARKAAGEVPSRSAPTVGHSAEVRSKVRTEPPRPAPVCHKVD